MKIKVTRRFIDRANGNMYRNPGRIYEAPEERARFLINLGLAEDFDEGRKLEYRKTKKQREFLIDKDVTYRVKSRKGKTITLEVVL